MLRFGGYGCSCEDLLCYEKTLQIFFGIPPPYLRDQRLPHNLCRHVFDAYSPVYQGLQQLLSLFSTGVVASHFFYFVDFSKEVLRANWNIPVAFAFAGCGHRPEDPSNY